MRTLALLIAASALVGCGGGDSWPDPHGLAARPYAMILRSDGRHEVVQKVQIVQDGGGGMYYVWYELPNGTRHLVPAGLEATFEEGE